jgi:hypothetical protein
MSTGPHVSVDIQQTKTLCLVKLTPHADETAISKPFNLAIVADVSGSMGGSKLTHTKEAIKNLVAQLKPGDKITLITYSDDCTTVFKSVSPVDMHDDINNKVDALRTQSNTNIYGALNSVYDHFAEIYEDGSINQIFFFSDGQPTAGKVCQTKLLLHEHRKLIAPFTKAGKTIHFTSYGIGSDYDGYFMKGLSDNAKGNFYYISDGENIPVAITNGLKVASAMTSNKNIVGVKATANDVKIKLYSPNGFTLNEGKVNCCVIYDDPIYLLFEHEAVDERAELMEISYEGQHNTYSQTLCGVSASDDELGHFKEIAIVVKEIEEAVEKVDANALRKLLDKLEKLEGYPEIKPMIDRYYTIINSYLEVAAHVPGMLNLTSTRASTTGDLYTTAYTSKGVSMQMISDSLDAGAVQAAPRTRYAVSAPGTGVSVLAQSTMRGPHANRTVRTTDSPRKTLTQKFS